MNTNHSYTNMALVISVVTQTTADTRMSNPLLSGDSDYSNITEQDSKVTSLACSAAAFCLVVYLSA